MQAIFTFEPDQIEEAKIRLAAAHKLVRDHPLSDLHIPTRPHRRAKIRLAAAYNLAADHPFFVFHLHLPARRDLIGRDQNCLSAHKKECSFLHQVSLSQLSFFPSGLVKRSVCCDISSLSRSITLSFILNSSDLVSLSVCCEISRFRYCHASSASQSFLHLCSTLRASQHVTFNTVCQRDVSHACVRLIMEVTRIADIAPQPPRMNKNYKVAFLCL